MKNIKKFKKVLIAIWLILILVMIMPLNTSGNDNNTTEIIYN